MNKNNSVQKRCARHIMRALKINEISGVDKPAQEGARAMILKRVDDQEDDVVEKQVSLTTPAEGHSHLIYLDNGNGELNAGDTSYTNGHSHPWIRTDLNSIVIGESLGHTHDLGEVSKAGKVDEGAMPDGSYPIKTKANLKDAIQAFGRAKNKAAVARHIKARATALGLEDVLPSEGVLADLLAKSVDIAAGDISGKTVGTKEETMPDNKQTAVEIEAAKNLKQVETLTKSLEKANRILVLKSDVRAFYETLDEKAKETFLAKSAEEQTAEIAKSKDADPVVYKTASGVEYRKSDDSRLVLMAKQNDELAKSAAESKAQVLESEIRKRASQELSHLPGTEEVHVALLKAVDKIEDKEQREKVLETLKSKDAAMKSAFETKGHKASTESGSAEDELDVMAKAYAETNKVSFEKAYGEVVKSEKGRELYKKSQA